MQSFEAGSHSAQPILVQAYSALWDYRPRPPVLEDFLYKHRLAEPEVLLQVLLIDQHRHWQQELPRPLGFYLNACPAVANNSLLRCQLLLSEYELREHFGESSQVSKLVSEYPELARLVNDESVDFSAPSEADSGSIISRPVLPPSRYVGSGRPRPVLPSGEEEDPEEIHADYTEFIASCEAFASLKREVIEILQVCLFARRYQSGEHLLHQGAEGDELLVIHEGEVEVYMTDSQGNRYVLDRIGAGQVLGEMALLTDEPRSASAVACGEVRVLVLPAETFHHLVQDFPVISMVLTHLLAKRLGNEGRDVLRDREFSGYRIGRRLGRGGMAIVYEATDTRTGERVAVKMMNHRLVYDAQALAQFRREAELIEQFRHPNLTQMKGRFSAFQTYFIVVPYCDGLTLRDVIQLHGRLTEDACRKILGQVVSALDYAHEAGIVHRDIKPPNIMLDRDGRVQLMDFGLAKPLDEIDATQRGVIVGTPRYMSPEQMRGEPVDTRADYYALGCVMVEMLTGDSLFPKASYSSLLMRLEMFCPPKVRKICPDISDELCDLLITWLDHVPAAREFDREAVKAWAGPVPDLLPPLFSESDTRPGVEDTEVG